MSRERKSSVLRFAFAVVLGIVGVVIALASDGALEIIGWGILAVAATLVVSFFFLEVGLSEDRARDAGLD